MGRATVRQKRKVNKINGQETFSKKRSRLLRKANETSVLCGAEVALIVFSSNGKLFEYSTDSCMERILEGYKRNSYAERRQLHGDENAKLEDRMKVLLSNQKHFMGEDLENLSLNELHNIERQFFSYLNLVRSRQNQLLLQFTCELQKKEKLLQEQNNLLAEKLHQQNHDLDLSNVLMLPWINGYYQMEEGSGDDEDTTNGN